jgi:hypothetical protein
METLTQLIQDNKRDVRLTVNVRVPIFSEVRSRVWSRLSAASDLPKPLDARRYRDASGAAKLPGQERQYRSRLILMDDWCDS